MKRRWQERRIQLRVTYGKKPREAKVTVWLYAGSFPFTWNDGQTLKDVVAAVHRQWHEGQKLYLAGLDKAFKADAEERGKQPTQRPWPWLHAGSTNAGPVPCWRCGNNQPQPTVIDHDSLSHYECLNRTFDSMIQSVVTTVGEDGKPKSKIKWIKNPKPVLGLDERLISDISATKQ